MVLAFSLLVFQVFGRDVSRKGQSFAEYALAAALVAIVSVGALSYFNTELSNALPDLLGRIFNGGGGSVATVPPTIVGIGPSSTVQVTPGSGPGLANITLTLDSGSKITLPDYPLDAGDLIETSGANGTTNKLAAILSALTQQLVAEGEITPAQANLLQNLANAGHDLAVVQKAAEEKITSCDPNAWYTSDCAVSIQDLPLSYTMDPNFTTYDPLSLVKANSSVLVQFNSLYGEEFPMLKFQDYLTEVQTSGALNDPMVQEVVNSLVKQIEVMSDDLLNTTNTIWLGSTPNTTLNNQLVSNKTHVNSAGICGAGGTIDLGTHCPGSSG